ncbi:DUF7922 domain-containing protein [Cellulosilyticum sp. I15G10I2]|uniref:DUF7922 domain-containing protein n=1 Tax=Cellulosilyticum sp. I15G10I2 TaxID=1892843 RepID=UPI00114D2679|nr:hypothetical protein [Cellulosilyticum sp. I15G10I2]
MNSLISLEENMPTYGINGKKVNGHVTISTPGIIKCYVQNLNPLEGQQFILYVFSSKENKGVRIGVLASPDKSRETKWRVDEKNVMDSGMMAKDIDAVAVVKEGTSMRETDTILVGFARNKYIISSILQQLLAEYHKQMSEQNGTEVTQPSEDMQIDIPEYVTEVPEPQVDEEIEVPEYVTEVPEPQADVEIEVPDYVTDMPELEMDEEIEVPDYIMDMPELEMDEEIQTLDDMPFMDPMEDMEEPEIDNNNDWNNNYNNTEDNDGMQHHAEMPQTTMERVLREAYINRQDYRDAAHSVYNRQHLNEKKEDQGKEPVREKTLQDETPEEIDYLEEIEKKLKDIQTRLKGSNTLERDIKRFQASEFMSETGYQNERSSSDSDIQIEELAKKLAMLKNSITEMGTHQNSTNKEDTVEIVYKRALKIQPFDYRTDEIEWVRISLSDLNAVSSLPKEWATQPFVAFSYYKYNEIILGKEKHTDKYYVGIPDIYHPERRGLLQPEHKVQKFVCRRDVEPAIGEYGYWLISL